MQHGQRAAVGGEIHHRPGPPAERPGIAVLFAHRLTPGSDAAPEALKGQAERFRQRLGFAQVGGFLARELLEQRLIGPRHADRLVLEEHEPLQIDFLHADFGGDAHEGRQLGDGLACRPVSQAETLGLAWPSRSCSARNAFTLRKMRSK